jgi:nuclear pore complex protein Nup205
VTLLDRTVVRQSANDDDTNLIEMGVDVFQSFGEKLFDILCHDATVGHDVAKMLSLSCIDMLLDLDAMTNFIYFISKRGYLSNLIDSLLSNDVKLCRVLDANPENLKPLYVYESKMAALSRIGSSYIGAELLLEHKALAVLATMKVFDLHPDFQVNNYNKFALASATSSFIPPVEIRYQQILFPALNLCDVVLSTLSSDNRSTVTQIINFLLSHGDMIEIVLRAGTPFLNLGLLQELSAITGIIARAANQGVSQMIDAQENQDLSSHLYRMQKLMMTLFPRFLVAEKMLKEKLQPLDEEVRADHLKCILEVAVNLALYARNSVTNNSVDHRVTSVLFAPTISEGGYR